MIAPLDDLAVLQDHDGVGVAHRGETVRDDEGGALRHQAVHALLDVFLCSRIDGTRRLVEDQDRRLGHRCPRDI